VPDDDGVNDDFWRWRQRDTNNDNTPTTTKRQQQLQLQGTGLQDSTGFEANSNGWDHSMTVA